MSRHTKGPELSARRPLRGQDGLGLRRRSGGGCRCSRCIAGSLRGGVCDGRDWGCGRVGGELSDQRRQDCLLLVGIGFIVVKPRGEVGLCFDDGGISRVSSSA